jgi:SM-20-related protein
LFALIAQDLVENGYSVQEKTLPLALTHLLLAELQSMRAAAFQNAGTGRLLDHGIRQTIRGDSISWLDDQTIAGAAWLRWTAALQLYLNRHLFLGLSPLESHYARYSIGDCYKKHLDAFVGASNRKISLVLYLNEAWVTKDEGELLLYVGKDQQTVLKIEPTFGTIVLFLSEDVAHEVRTAQAERLSIAGWFSCT